LFELLGVDGVFFLMVDGEFVYFCVVFGVDVVFFYKILLIDEMFGVECLCCGGVIVLCVIEGLEV